MAAKMQCLRDQGNAGGRASGSLRTGHLSVVLEVRAFFLFAYQIIFQSDAGMESRQYIRVRSV